MRRGSVISQFLVAFSVVAVLIGATAAVGYTAVRGHNEAADQVTGRYTVLQQADNALETAYGTAEFAVLFYIGTGQRTYLAALPLARSAFADNLATLRRLATPGLRLLAARQARTGAAWFALAPKVAAARPGSPAARALLGRARRLGNTFLDATTAMQDRLHASIERLTAESKHSLSAGLAWGGVALAVALLLVLVSSLSTLYTVTRPLRGLTATVRRLTAGETSARAAVTGAAEVREVARSVNIQADESDRLRAQSAESTRLRAMAREAGLRIREHLTTGDLLAEALAALRGNLAADVAYLRLVEDGTLGKPIGLTPGRQRGDVIARRLTPQAVDALDEALRAQASLVTQDVGSDEGNAIPPEIREPLREAGVVSQIVTPFGAGTAMLGLIVMQRTRPGRPWSTAERDAVESIAADLGRGLNQARLYEAENRLVADLRTLNRAKSDFFATVSHELRAPLTTIEGYVEMLGDEEAGPITAAQRKMLETIDRSSVRLRNLVEDLFTLSKLESGVLNTVMQPVGMAEIVSGALAAVRPSAEAAGLALACQRPGAGLAVEGDAGQLERVLINLLSNAVKFTPKGGEVELAASADGDWVVITVSDTGIGIPERDQKELFSRFYRASNATSRRIPGTGLGLAIVATIVGNHHGEVSLTSEEGVGTTVTVRLPLLPERAG
jgi:signal transduction histidine kinase/CHASE3 domain sensor protein